MNSVPVQHLRSFQSTKVDVKIDTIRYKNNFQGRAQDSTEPVTRNNSANE